MLPGARAIREFAAMLLPTAWLIVPAPPASSCTSPVGAAVSTPASVMPESVERRMMSPAFAVTVPGAADTLSAPPAVVILTPPFAVTAPSTVSPPAESTSVNFPEPSATEPTDPIWFERFASVASAFAVANVSTFPVITPVPFCVITLPAPPVVVSETFPAPAFSTLLTASTPLVFSVTPPVAPTAPVTVSPPASSRFSVPVPSVTAPRFVTAFVAVFKVALAFAVAKASVPAVITPVAFCVIAFPAPVVVSETMPPPAFSVLFTASAPLVFSVTPPVAPTAPVTVSPPASSRFSAPVPKVTAPKFVTAFVAAFKVAFAFAVANVSVAAVTTPVPFCVIAFPAPVVVSETVPAAALTAWFTASTPLVAVAVTPAVVEVTVAPMVWFPFEASVTLPLPCTALLTFKVPAFARTDTVPVVEVTPTVVTVPMVSAALFASV